MIVIDALTEAVTDIVADDELRIGIDGSPRPYVASAFRCGLGSRDVLFLGMAERLNLVALELARLQLANFIVLNAKARLPRLF